MSMEDGPNVGQEGDKHVPGNEFLDCVQSRNVAVESPEGIGFAQSADAGEESSPGGSLGLLFGTTRDPEKGNQLAEPIGEPPGGLRGNGSRCFASCKDGREWLDLGGDGHGDLSLVSGGRLDFGLSQCAPCCPKSCALTLFVHIGGPGE